ncbi:sigma factor regulatory protein, FecR/PupR family, partial [Bordetella holmesii H620]
MRVPTPIWSQA